VSVVVRDVDMVIQVSSKSLENSWFTYEHAPKDLLETLSRPSRPNMRYNTPGGRPEPDDMSGLGLDMVVQTFKLFKMNAGR